MKKDYIKQIRCVSAQDSMTFENAMNEALVGMADPVITFDKTRPFTAYIEYTMQRDLPEGLLELLEMVCGYAFCCDCPCFEAPTDKRRKWGECKLKGKSVRMDAYACEVYYLRDDGVSIGGAISEVLQIPYKSTK